MEDYEYTDEADVLEEDDIVPATDYTLTVRKACFGCSEIKPLNEFYKHPKMADGHLGKCKTCVRAATRKNRAEKIDYYTEYERTRANLPHRVEARANYAKTDHGKAVIRAIHERSAAKPENKARRLEAQRESRVVNEKKHYAREQVAYAVRTGKMFKPTLCENCNEPHPQIEGHHRDYNFPLDVDWLCKPCHTQWHLDNEAIE